MGLYITLSTASIRNSVCISYISFCICISESTSTLVCSLHNYALQRPLSATAATDTSAQSAGLPRLVPACPMLPNPTPFCPALPCRGILGGATFLVPACLVSRIKQFSAWFALFACACPFSSLRSPFSTFSIYASLSLSLLHCCCQSTHCPR